ncbi:MAG: PfkB family carbohydrate kinase [Bacteroidota bacterium]|nr:PfkB family carbohydrate kinase [Bacteroidota bacterium]MDX5428702.1 PfkB family carbohydrate kinase [Bacteroidota bacterium]MDX5506431.1 PfkB family carbohydrate kinase [Bacteroidota bacterium]
MTREEIANIFEGMNSTRVLLIGDAMIDAYMWGSVERMSPEAPVPVVLINKREKRLGGAGNVAINLHGLGAETFLCSLVGDDDNGTTMRNLMEDEGLTTEGLFTVSGRHTTVKTRIISRGKHVLRVDEEDTRDLSDYSGFIEHLQDLMDRYPFDVVIFQDYNKGTIHPQVIQKITDLSLERGIPVAVDPKKKNFLSYKKVTLFKPNLKEISEGLQMDVDPTFDSSLRSATDELMGHLDCQQVMVTLSEHGVYIRDRQIEHHLPAHKRTIVDVSGAGDTVISVASLALAQGVEPRKLAFLANLAGGLVCEEVGVVPIDRGRLQSEAEIHGDSI